MKELIKNKVNYSSLIFRLDKDFYALRIDMISSILILEDESITTLPNTSKEIRGIMNLRGDIIAIIDLRYVFGIISLDEEYREFKDMLDARKQDHLNWVEALQRSVDTGEEFTLATDPHKCKLGVWYDNFKTEFDSINYHIRKLDEPHKKLHKAALEVKNCSKDCEACERKECLKDIFVRIEKEYVPKIVSLLEDAKDVFMTNFKEMVIALDIGDQRIGIIVDEVLGIENLIPLEKKYSLGNGGKNYILHTAKSEALDDVVMVINDKELFSSLGVLE